MSQICHEWVAKGSRIGRESKHLYLSDSINHTMVRKNKNRILKFKVLVEQDEEGYYVADVPELQGCHTQAKDKKELMKRVKKVIALCLEDEAPVFRKVDVKEIEIPFNPNKLIFA